MNVLLLIKHNSLDQSIVNFTLSLFKDSSVNYHLLNIVQVNGEIPLQPNGQVLDFCTEFDLSGYNKTAKEQLVYLKSFKNESISQRNSFVGDKIKIIKDYVKANNIDIIVGGAHRTSLIEDVFVQTFANRVMDNTNLPYLTIKCNRDNFIPKKIAIICDFNTPNKEDLASIKHIADIHQSEIKLIKIQTAAETRSTSELEYAMQEYASVNNLNATTHIVINDDKEGGINELQNEHQADLIAIGRSHKSALFSLFNNNEQTDIVNHVFAPILIY